MLKHNFISIQLEDRSIFNPICKDMATEFNLQFSEYSFANIFLFRKQHNYEVSISDTPLIRGKFSDGTYYLIPTQPIDLFIKATEDLLKTENHVLYPISEGWLLNLKARGFTFTHNRDDSDYLFHKDKLKTLSGRALSSRRNLLSQLFSQHRLKTDRLDSSNAQQARILLDQWQEDVHLPKEKTDYHACVEALQNISHLELIGKIVSENEKIIAFYLGEKLTEKTAILQFAKGLHDVKGITPFLYKDFASNLSEETEWVNVEQDLGISSLRQAKRAFDPDLILTKWRARYV